MEDLSLSEVKYAITNPVVVIRFRRVKEAIKLKADATVKFLIAIYSCESQRLGVVNVTDFKIDLIVLVVHLAYKKVLEV